MGLLYLYLYLGILIDTNKGVMFSTGVPSCRQEYLRMSLISYKTYPITDLKLAF